MSFPHSISAPRRCKSSRLSACTSVSPASTRPPGNSHIKGSTAVVRRCVMRYCPSRSRTAATTRMVRCAVMSHRDAEQLLPHEEDVARADLHLLADANERAVRAAQIGEHASSVVPRKAAVQTRDVAVLGEEDVA